MPRKKKTKTKSKRKTAKSASTKQTKKSARATHELHPRKKVKKGQSRKKSSSKTSPPRRRKAPRVAAQRFESPRAGGRAASDRQSGDFEGLSRAEQADSESVDELVEEGNVFEAGAVAGVEEADGEDTKEVHTHEVSEDDVPDEYLDKD